MASSDVAQVLPKELRLGAPPQMPQARSYMFKQPSTLSSYKSDSQSTIQINLPRLQRSYLTKDSYLRFKLSFDFTTSAQAEGVAFDSCGAYGLFDKLEIFDYLGSTSLESISGHGQLMALLLDLHTDVVDGSTHSAITSGTQGIPIGSTTVTGLSVTNSTVNTSVTTFPSTAGTAVGTLASSAVGGTSVGEATTGEVLIPSGAVSKTRRVTKEYSIPLLSFLGLLSPKFVPLHNGYTIMLTLNTATQAFITFSNTTSAATSSPSAYTLYDVNMHCQILELGPVAESMLLSSTGGQPLVVHGKTFRRYTGTVSGQPEFRIPLNLNVASLTNILWFMRSKTDVDSAYYPSLGNRVRGFLQNWYFQYGSSVLPQTTGIVCMADAPTSAGYNTNTNGVATDYTKLATLSCCYKEAYAELTKARHTWNSDNHNTKINPSNYEWDQNWLSTTTFKNLTTKTQADLDPYTRYGTGKFACGLDLELVSGKSNDLISGLNTNGMNTMIAGRFHPTYYDKQFLNGPPVATVAEDGGSVLAAGTTKDTLQVDAFAEYDSFVNISPGIATTVSF